jgi:NodT family efflux transporter outer membrane factor (OMF) lipoprotein
MRNVPGVLIGVVLLASGCVIIGPDFIPPPAPVADAWLEKDEAQLTSATDHHEEWWSVFDDPVLNALVEEASLQNLGLQGAGLRILEARAQLGIATGNLYPQVQQLNAEASTVGGSRNAANSIGGSLDAAWELDFWGKFRRGVESADARYLATIADYDDIMVTLTAEVARTYILIRTLEERIRLAEESVATQRRSLEIAENRFEGGLVTELDVQQARSLLANTEALIPRFKVDLQRAQHALSVLLGTPPADLAAKLKVPGEGGGIPEVPAKVAVGIPADLLRRRPDIRRAELQAAAQSPLIGVAKADLLPHFTLIGSIGLRASDSPLTAKGGSSVSDLVDSDSVTYFAGPSLSWDLLNYGRIRNEVRVQDARFQQTIVNYQDTVLRAAQEVEDAMAGFLRGQEEAAFLAEAVAASRRSVEIALLQYGEGLTDYQRVLDTQRGLTADQDNLTATQGSVALDLVGMYKSLGGGWQMRDGQDLVPAKTHAEMADRTNWGSLLDPEKPAPAETTERPGWRWPDW